MSTRRVTGSDDVSSFMKNNIIMRFILSILGNPQNRAYRYRQLLLSVYVAMGLQPGSIKCAITVFVNKQSIIMQNII